MFASLYTSHWKVLGLQLLFTALTFPLAYIVLLLTESQTIREYAFYVLIVCAGASMFLLAVKALHVAYGMVRSFSGTWSTAAFIVCAVVSLFTTSWIPLFAGLLLVGFS